MAEVFPDHGRAEEVLAGEGGDDEHGVEEDDADEDVGYGGVGYRSPADEDGRRGEEARLVVGVVGGEVAHVLEEDDLARAGEGRGDEDGHDPGALHGDARGIGHGHVLADGPHILAELGLLEPDDEDTEGGYDEEGDERYGESPDPEHENLIQGLAHGLEVERVADAVAAREDDGRVPDGDDRSHQIEDEELVDAVDEEGEDVAGDHLPALGLVHHRAADPAEKEGYGKADEEGEDQALPARHSPVHGEDEADLPGHGAQGHGEVEAHARVDGQEKGDDEEGVAPQPRDHLLDDVGDGEAGGTHGREGYGQENEDDGVFREPGAEGLALGAHLLTFTLRVSA